MTNGESARDFLKGERLPKLAKLAGHTFRWHVAESFAKHRGRLHGEKLREQIHADLQAESAIPPWMIAILVDLAIKAIMAILERWWHRPSETWGHA